MVSFVDQIFSKCPFALPAIAASPTKILKSAFCGFLLLSNAPILRASLTGRVDLSPSLPLADQPTRIFDAAYGYLIKESTCPVLENSVFLERPRQCFFFDSIPEIHTLPVKDRIQERREQDNELLTQIHQAKKELQNERDLTPKMKQLLDLLKKRAGSCQESQEFARTYWMLDDLLNEGNCHEYVVQTATDVAREARKGTSFDHVILASWLDQTLSKVERERSKQDLELHEQILQANKELQKEKDSTPKIKQLLDLLKERSKQDPELQSQILQAKKLLNEGDITPKIKQLLDFLKEQSKQDLELQTQIHQAKKELENEEMKSAIQVLLVFFFELLRVRIF